MTTKVALAMCDRLQGFIHLRAEGLVSQQFSWDMVRFTV